MEIFRRRPSPGVLVAAIGVLVGLGGIAVAAIPDSSGVIHGCYQKNSGNLRVADAAADCRNSETAIQWNERGPAGPPGSVGPEGQRGRRGRPGPAGPPGGAQNIVARARTSAEFTLNNTLSALPLAGDTWAREAGELNQIFGRITVRMPASCRDDGRFPAYAISIQVNGEFVGPVGVSSYQAGLGVTQTREFGPTNTEPLWPTDAPSTSTVTVSAQDNCVLGEHVVVSSADIVVLGFRPGPGVP